MHVRRVWFPWLSPLLCCVISKGPAGRYTLLCQFTRDYPGLPGGSLFWTRFFAPISDQTGTPKIAKKLQKPLPETPLEAMQEKVSKMVGFWTPSAWPDCVRGLKSRCVHSGIRKGLLKCPSKAPMLDACRIQHLKKCSFERVRKTHQKTNPKVCILDGGGGVARKTLQNPAWGL